MKQVTGTNNVHFTVINIGQTQISTTYVGVKLVSTLFERIELLKNRKLD